MTRPTIQPAHRHSDAMMRSMETAAATTAVKDIIAAVECALGDLVTTRVLAGDEVYVTPVGADFEIDSWMVCPGVGLSSGQFYVFDPAGDGALCATLADAVEGIEP